MADISSIKCPSFLPILNDENDIRNPLESHDTDSSKFRTALTEEGDDAPQINEDGVCNLIESLESQFQGICEKMKEFKERLSIDVKGYNTILLEDKRKLHEDLRKSNDTINNLNEEIERLKKNTQCNDSNSFMEKEEKQKRVIRHLARNIKERDKVMDEVLDKNKTLKHECDNLKKKMDNFSDIQDPDQLPANMSIAITRLQEENAQLRDNIEKRDKVMDEVLEKNKTLKHECEHLKKKMDNFSDIQDPDELSNDISIAINRLQEENAQLKENIEKHKTKTDAMKEKIRLAKRKQEELVRNMKTQSEEKSMLLKEQFETYDELDEKNKEMFNELEVYRCMVSTLEEEIRQMNDAGVDLN